MLCMLWMVDVREVHRGLIETIAAEGLDYDQFILHGL